jgi:hypothetical protein
VLIVGVLTAGCASKPAGIMPWPSSWPQWPYVIEMRCGDGALFYYGARHTFDAEDPQIAQIEAEWTRFRPDIAFNEGGSPPFQKTRDDAVSKGGESSFVRYLAMRDDVPTTTLDPSRAEEVAALATRFSREKVKTYFLVRGAMQFIERHGTERVDDEINRILAIYDATPGLRGSPRTVEELRAIFDLSAVQREWFDPAKTGTWMNDISRASSDYRDQHMVEFLTRHARDGRRVFAVAGGSHVFMQEPALRSRCR